MRTEQQQFQALFQAQQEDQQVLRSLIVLAGTPAAVSVVAVGFPPVSLTKMWSQDDLEAFLELFERAAEAWGWPEEQQAAQLLQVLSGEAQLRAQQLPPRTCLDLDLKCTILQCVGHTPEQQSQRFCTLTMEGVGQPFAFAQQLQDACIHLWLRAEECNTKGIIDTVVLEQFITQLPGGATRIAEGQDWLGGEPSIGTSEGKWASCPFPLSFSLSPVLFLPFSLHPSHTCTMEVGFNSPAPSFPNPWFPTPPSPLCLCFFSFPGK
ncbi:uncharacterized protein LOC132875191 [Neoarius graeffei]|uniref:uncharacterized protein LOC132875191 n=1 Tax=Neoarius graeffei TaxID=443677 RepID=UPI00298C1133|nr:uncharacterized protein LOC132875191 [Neoarius graeffei]XP_060767865.1 uncharacterized protein LOC132875191 [Neoarius graeffei]